MYREVYVLHEKLYKSDLLPIYIQCTSYFQPFPRIIETHWGNGHASFCWTLTDSHRCDLLRQQRAHQHQGWTTTQQSLQTDRSPGPSNNLPLHHTHEGSLLAQPLPWTFHLLRKLCSVSPLFFLWAPPGILKCSSHPTADTSCLGSPWPGCDRLGAKQMQRNSRDVPWGFLSPENFNLPQHIPAKHRMNEISCDIWQNYQRCG